MLLSRLGHVIEQCHTGLYAGQNRVSGGHDLGASFRISDRD
jgi:hypothetical protein